MGVEVEESNLPVVSGEAEVTVVDESSLSKENGKAEEVVVEKVEDEPITFGSHGVDEPAKEEIIKPAAEVSKFPKDAVDEWPEAQQIHPFFIQKYRQFEDPKIKAKLEQADLELTKKNQARSQLIDKLRKLRGEKAEKITLLKASNEERRQYKTTLDEKMKVRNPLKEALGTLSGKGERALHISEESLNAQLRGMEYRIQHETISLKEEKEIMKDMKRLEATRPQVIALAAQRAKILESMGEKTDLQAQMKLLDNDMDGVRKDKLTVAAKLKQVEEEKEAIDKKIKAVEEELDELSEKRDKAYQSILELRKQRDEGNSAYYQNRSLLNEIRGLANKKDLAAVKEKVDTELSNWMSQYVTNTSFREDAVKRVMTGLDNRQITKDGRMRNFDEKLIFVVEKITPPETEAVSRTLPKQAPPPKEEVAAPAPAPAVVEKEKSGKAQKESKKANKANAAAKAVDEADEPDFYVPEKKGKEAPQVQVVDEAKLKEIIREQEIAKAKQASERKRKLTEKAAAKAAIRAQKEAEKKQKALEKKEKKKAGVSVDESKETEAAAEEVAESDKSAAEEAVETTVSSKNKDKKAVNNPMKRRVVRPRGLDSVPKPLLLKRKKATNYWMWAAPAGVVLALLVAGALYFSRN